MTKEEEATVIVLIGVATVISGLILGFLVGFDIIASLFLGVLLGSIVVRIITWDGDLEAATDYVIVRVFIALSDVFILLFGLYIVVIYSKAKNCCWKTCEQSIKSCKDNLKKSCRKSRC